MNNRTVLGLVFIVFCAVVGYQLIDRPTRVLNLSTIPTSTAYGPTVVDDMPENEGDHGLTGQDDECRVEEVCTSWSGCMAACDATHLDPDCYADCVVDEQLELDLCESDGLCFCDSFQQFCSVFCRADG